jgi:hypothetical protein
MGETCQRRSVSTVNDVVVGTPVRSWGIMIAMAGRMNKRGTYGSMADRVARSHEPAPGPPRATPEPLPLKHCWVTTTAGRHPGLLLEWRNVAGAWEGRVVHPVPDPDGWVLLEEWLPAGLLDPA